MKVYLRLFSVLLMLCLCCINVYADNGLTVSSMNVETKNNRLFDVDVSLKYNSHISATTCELKYDSNMFEYRSVDTDIADSQVEANCNDGIVKLIFLNSDGVYCDGEKILFSVKFKSLNPGNSKINITTYDLVDNNAQPISVKDDTQVEINVTGSSSNVAGKSVKSNRKIVNDDKDNKEDINKNDNEKKKKSKSLSLIKDTLDYEEMFVIVICVFSLILILVCSFTVIKINNLEAKLKEKDNE